MKRVNKKFTGACSILCLTFACFSVSINAQVYSQSGGTATKANQSYSTATTDQSAVTVSNSGVLSLTNSTIKTTGNTTSQDSSSFYGLNAGVLAQSGSTINLTGCSISTTGTGANGVFSTGTGTSIVMINDTVYCTGSGGHGVDATLTGTLTMKNCIVTTTESHGAAIATDRGGGTITATGGIFTTSGTDSPGIYSTGTVAVSDATINAIGSEGVVIEGANTATLINTKMTAAKGTRDRGVMVYQSMSGDASGNKGIYTQTGGTYSWTSTTGPAFYATNTTAVITLKGITINNSSPILVKAAADQWGNSGKNGGNVIFTADSETVTGNLICDNISSITAVLQNYTTLSGSIDSASLTLDATSKWVVTGTSYLTSLSDASGISGTTISNIVGNGNLVYYNAGSSANSSLGGKTYTLTNGGKLLPYGVSAVKDEQDKSKTGWQLEQNYPNPFNPSTTIKYTVPVAGKVVLKVYDMTGKEVATLVNGQQEAGAHEIAFNALNLASGVYLYMFRAGNSTQSKKMILMK